ncbi:MAG: DUF4258 domain-containing protein [Planctomycetes bacterium]|nr:DUF4258 domain-containing protein [Planctomycetota bacterium]
MAGLSIEWVRARVRASEYLFTLHADEERRNDSLDILEVETAMLSGTILEDYPGVRVGRRASYTGGLGRPTCTSFAGAIGRDGSCSSPFIYPGRRNGKRRHEEE